MTDQDDKSAKLNPLILQGNESSPIRHIHKSELDQSSHIEDIISSQLPFIVQWGTLLFLLILVSLAFVCWFIQYPDIVTTSGKLNSINAPREVITKVSGKLLKIAVDENDFVESGQILGQMESTTSLQSVNLITKQINTINQLFARNQDEEILQFLPNYTKQQSFNNLGELQPAYQSFIESFIQFKNILKKGFLQHKKVLLLGDLRNTERMALVLAKQRSLLLQDLELTNKNFEANKVLAENKVIASLDYRNEKSKLLAKQLTLPQINATIISNESLLNAKKEEIAELNNQINNQKYAFIQALGAIKSQIQAWELKYLLKAPVSGNIAFTGFFQENQEMKLGQALFYVQPKNSSYFVEIVVPQYNFGKVNLGQRVTLKFQAYPFEQYGVVTGKVAYISALPMNNGYLAKVFLPSGLLTNQKKKLHFQQGLLVQADIITKNMSLLERFYYDLSKQLGIQK